MNAREKKNAREKARWANLSPEKREKALIKKRLRTAKQRASAKNDEHDMKQHVQNQDTEIEQLKDRNTAIERDLVEVLNCFLPSTQDHSASCPRVERKKKHSTTSTRVSNGVQYSCIAPLNDITNLNVFIGSHLEKRFNNGGQRGQRLYHTMTKKRIQLNVGEVIVFDGNLCHCGGDSTVTNPR
jgi:hypothetical protein